jgi:hypothetical protein
MKMCKVPKLRNSELLRRGERLLSLQLLAEAARTPGLMSTAQGPLSKPSQLGSVKSFRMPSGLRRGPAAAEEATSSSFCAHEVNATGMRLRTVPSVFLRLNSPFFKYCHLRRQGWLSPSDSSSALEEQVGREHWLLRLEAVAAAAVRPCSLAQHWMLLNTC